MKYRVCTLRAISFLLCISAVFISCKEKKLLQEQREKFIVIKPRFGQANYQREYVAEIRSLQHVEIRSRAKGFLEKIFVDEGSFVQQGQVLFAINNKEYRDEVSKSNATLKNAEAELKQVEVEMKNIQLLTDKNIISPSELAMVQAKKDAVLATIQQAKTGISLSNTYLGYTQIRAPFSGYINRLPKKTGSLVEEGDLLTTLSNNKEIYTYFNVSETDYLIYIKNPDKSKEVRLMLADGTVYQHTGIIETVDGEINTETGTVAFRAKFSNPENILKNGSSGKVLLNKQLNNAVLIPIKSTYEVQENLYVYVVDKSGTVTQRRIEPVARLADEYAIKGGVSADETILYEGVQLVKEGDKVQPVFKTLNELSNL